MFVACYISVHDRIRSLLIDEFVLGLLARTIVVHYSGGKNIRSVNSGRYGSPWVSHLERYLIWMEDEGERMAPQYPSWYWRVFIRIHWNHYVLLCSYYVLIIYVWNLCLSVFTSGWPCPWFSQPKCPSQPGRSLSGPDDSLWGNLPPNATAEELRNSLGAEVEAAGHSRRQMAYRKRQTA